MRKLKLDVEALVVESFDTVRNEPDKGTVVGNADLIIGAGEIIIAPATASCHIDFCADSWMSGCRTCGDTCNQKTAPCLTCDITGCVSCRETCETCYGPSCVTACLPTCTCA